MQPGAQDWTSQIIEIESHEQMESEIRSVNLGMPTTKDLSNEIPIDQ